MCAGDDSNCPDFELHRRKLLDDLFGAACRFAESGIRSDAFTACRFRRVDRSLKRIGFSLQRGDKSRRDAVLSQYVLHRSGIGDGGSERSSSTVAA